MSQLQHFGIIGLSDIEGRGVAGPSKAPALSAPKSGILSGRPLTIGESVGLMMLSVAAVVGLVVWWLFFRK